MKKLIVAGVAVIVIAGIIWQAFFARVAPPDFTQHPAGPERKAAFFDYFAPIVDELNADILAQRETVKQACAGEDPKAKLTSLAERYRVDAAELSDEAFCTTMLRRVDVIPPSLALAQGANESAWGTSRFAQQGNNFFGQWCFKQGCGIVPDGRDAGQNHEVADFRSPSASVESYMLNINRHEAYLPLRQTRQSLREAEKDITGLELTWGLDNYSERREEYGKELREMIRYNELTKFDEELNQE